MKEIANIASSARSEDELLSVAGEKIANHFGAERSTIAAELTRASGSSTEPVWMGERACEARAGQRFRPEVQLPLRFSSGEARCLVLGPRRGGRKYRGDDLDDMRRLAATVVEHVERFRAEELRRLVNQAELRALQAQINPHFLFNALNTLYGTIDRGSREARRMVVNMAEMFRYFLRGDRTLIPLSEELRIIEAYLEIEALRVGERLKTELIVSDSVKSTLIPVLSVQPLVENAVKHGVAAKQEGGRVSLKAVRIAAGLLITVEDTGVGFEHSQSLSPNGTGVGLDNVRRRPALCYGTSSELQIESSASGSSVSFVVPDSSPLEHLPAELETSSTAGT